MNIIPLVSINKGTLFDGKEGAALSLDDLFKRVEKDSLLYVLDYDGLEQNNPNFELYQRLTEHCTLWIDNGPRRLDDVMDTIMAGATNITLRQKLWPDLDMLGVQDITDDEIYLDLSKEHQESKTLHVPYAGDIGIILFNEETLYGGLSNEQTAQQKIVIYASSTEKMLFWDQQGITSVVLDLRKKQGAP